MSNQVIDEYVEDEIDFQYYWTLLLTVLRRYYKYLITFVFVCTAGAYFYVQTNIPTYTASLTLHLAHRDRQSWDNYYDGWSSNTVFQTTQLGILNSIRLAQRVLETLQEEKDTPNGFGSAVDELRVEDLQGAVSIELSDNRKVGYSNLITINATWTEPRFAARTANLIAESYIKLLFELEIDETLRDQTFLSERTVILKEDLRLAEQRLQDFREQQNILKVTSGLREVDEELSSMAARFYAARENRLKMQDMYDQVNKADIKGEEITNIPAVANHPRISNIRSTIFELDKRRSELANRYGPRHIKMIALEAEYKSARAAMQKRIVEVVKSIEAEYQFAVTNEKSLSAELETVRGRKQSIGRKDYQLNDLQQDVDVRRDVYSRFLELYSHGAAKGPSKNNNIWIVDPATPPEQADVRSTLKRVLLAAALSLFSGLGLGLLLELNRNNIAKERDIETNLGLTCLGVVPLVKPEKGAKHNDMVFREYFTKPFSQFSESIRSLRTSLSLQSHGGGGQRLMVASSQPGEGKTNLVLSLAASFAQMKKVLVIDCDLRKPSVCGFLGDGGRILGLTDVLAGAVAVEDCVKYHEASGMNYLCSGSKTLNPLEILISSEFTILLNQLSEEFEMIIMDTPPCVAVSDAYLVASHADTVIFVIGAESTKVPLIRKVVSGFHAHGIDITNVVLNQVDMESHTNYGYYHTEGYYGDAEEESPETKKAAAETLT